MDYVNGSDCNDSSYIDYRDVFVYEAKNEKLQQEHAGQFPKGERDEILEFDSELAIQEDVESVDNNDARAEGVSVQQDHRTEAMETAQEIGDV